MSSECDFQGDNGFMSDTDGLRYTKIPLNNGSDEIPALGFGTLIPDPIATKEATTTALEMDFRQFDCAERYRNEEHVGDAMRAVFKEGKVRREDVFVGTKLRNNNQAAIGAGILEDSGGQRVGDDRDAGYFETRHRGWLPRLRERWEVLQLKRG